ncbi:unnamed protein product [Fraxinus pennsylvanica]|uniref:Uncharacterized protein n=1 Tax=Fraxinus pennsylvanica TaxID=56036 RepID=A0AAD2AHQ4_9LAMI|nr:unnamed protein product [Fraxinus pennsylvanica]
MVIDIDRVIGWAAIASHHFMQCSDSSIKEPKLVISGERVPCLRFQDLVTENEFEKRFLVDVIPPGDVGVTFGDIGALENVKETLKELVMLPLQRPELFSEGQQMDLIYYAKKDLISTVY